MAIFDESAIIRKYFRSINFLKSTPPHPTKTSSTTSRDSDVDSYSSFSVTCQSDRVDSIKSCESVLKIFTFETNVFNKNNEKCLAFWNAINSRDDIQPVNCTIMDAQCNKKNFECQTEEKESEASLWARALYELRKRKLDKVALLTSTATCAFCKTINCRHISSAIDPRELLIEDQDLTELDNWSPRKSNKATQLKTEDLLKEKTVASTERNIIDDFKHRSDINSTLTSELNVVEAQVLPSSDVPSLTPFGKEAKSIESVSEKKRVSIIDVADQPKPSSTSRTEQRIVYKPSELSVKLVSYLSMSSSLTEMKSKSREISLVGGVALTKSASDQQTTTKSPSKMQPSKSSSKADYDSPATTEVDGFEIGEKLIKSASCPDTVITYSRVKISAEDLNRPTCSSSVKMQELMKPERAPRKSNLKLSSVSIPLDGPRSQTLGFQMSTTSGKIGEYRTSQRQISFVSKPTTQRSDKILSDSNMLVSEPPKVEKTAETGEPGIHPSFTDFSSMTSVDSQATDKASLASDNISQETSLLTTEDDLKRALQYLSETMGEEGTDIEKSKTLMEYEAMNFKNQSTDTPHLTSLLNVETLKHLESITKRKKKLENELRRLRLLEEGREIDPKIHLCSCIHTLKSGTCDECSCKHGICRKPNEADLQNMQKVVDHLPHKEQRKLTCFLKILYKIREIMKMNLDQQTADDMIVKALSGLGPCECEGGTCECRLHHLDVATMNADADFMATTIMDRFNRVLVENIRAKLGMNLAEKSRFKDKEVETEEPSVSNIGVPDAEWCNICKLQNCLCIMK